MDLWAKVQPPGNIAQIHGTLANSLGALTIVEGATFGTV
jgi:hypothetical protein